MNLSGKDFFTLTALVSEAAAEGLSKTEFLQRVLRLFPRYLDCDLVAVELAGGRSYPCAMAVRGREGDRGFSSRCGERSRVGRDPSAPPRAADLLSLLRAASKGRPDGPQGAWSPAGSFWATETAEFFPRFVATPGREYLSGAWGEGGPCRAVAVIPVEAGEAGAGTLLFGFERPATLTVESIEFLEQAVRMISASLRQWYAAWSLQERVKELSCLYAIANLLDARDKTLEELLDEVVEMIPAAWLHEDVAAARITFDGWSHESRGFGESLQAQAAPILVDGKQRGLLEVAYTEAMPELDEGPFLHEERELLDTIARELSLRVQRWLYEKEQREIKEQMRNSNRLAMIGQLSAAVAHEINEPLTSILGFAQLAARSSGLPVQVARDLERIVATSLHAREIVRKLLMFGRKMPQSETRVEANKMVREAIGFFEHRLARAGITLDLELSPEAGEMKVDPAQLRQVVANLFLNAMQATSGGGRITVRTAREGEDVLLGVEDTGCGMSREVLDRIFIPFFTTKEPHQGTGLGLSVVFDIVKSLGGRIEVESRPGHGSRFLVRLPSDPPFPDQGEGNPCVL